MTLKQWKRKNDISYTKLAEALGMSRQRVIELVKDPSPFLPLATVIKISELTGLSPYEYIKKLGEHIKSHRKITAHYGYQKYNLNFSIEK